MVAQPPEFALLSIPQASAVLGIGIKTVRSAVRDGQIRAVLLGRRQLISKSEIERLLERRT
jgi:excisionase family DNA binding protein